MLAIQWLNLGEENCMDFYSGVRYDFRLAILPELLRFYSIKVSYPATFPANFDIQKTESHFVSITGTATGYPLINDKIPACVSFYEFLSESFLVVSILFLIILIIYKIPTHRIRNFIESIFDGSGKKH